MRQLGLGAAFAAVLWAQVAGAQMSQQGPKLVPGDTSGAPWVASAVAVSADGSTAIVGGYQDTGGAGSAWIFTRVGGVWTQTGSKHVGTNASGNALQGWSVAISGDGSTAIVGGPGDTDGIGAAWVYALSGGNWAQQGNKLVGSGASGHAAQGSSVALSADGNTAIIGGPADNTGVGAVWVFVRSNGAWKQQGKRLVGSDVVGKAQMGTSVALSSDGLTAIVGGPADNSTVGASWIFTSSSGSWAQQGGKLVGLSPNTTFTIADNAQVTATLTQQPPPCLTLKVVTSPSKDGTVDVNTPKNCSGGYTRGTVISLTATPTTDRAFSGWSSSGGSLAAASSSYQATFTIADNANITAHFVKASSTCETFAVTSNPADGGNARTLTPFNCGIDGYAEGSAVVLVATPAAGWVFTGWSGGGGTFFNPSSAVTTFSVTGNATPTANFSLPPTTCDSLAVGASPGGSGSVTVNTAQNCPGGYIQGTPVSLTVNPASGWVLSEWSGSGGSFSSTIGMTKGGLQGSSVAISADGSTAVVGGSLDGYPAGAIWVFGRSGTAWMQQGNPIPASGDRALATQRWAVSLSGDGNTILAAEPGDTSGRGAAWLFARSGGSWSQIGGRLVGAGAVGRAEQGLAAALSSDGSTAVIGGPNDDGGVGAAWVFAQGAAPTCTLALSPTSQVLPAVGGAATVSVTVVSGTNCPWVAVSDAPWILTGDADGGTGAGVLSYGVSPNSGVTRSGTLSIGGQTLTVYQAGSNCSYALDPASMGFSESGGTGSFSVTATAGCPWSASSAASWLHVTNGAVVLGDGTVAFSVDPNTGAARSATIAVADQVFTVSQVAYVPPPQAAFEVTPESPVSGEIVRFTDRSTQAPTSWAWSFGDGAVSTMQNPTHSYAVAGTYEVTLTAANSRGQNTISKQLVVGSGVAVWLPVVSHTGGAAGSVWQSDVGVLNPGQATANVQGLFYGASGVVSGNFVVPAGGQTIVPDVVGLLGSQGSGALEVISDQAVVVTSRTYTASADGTVGEGFGSYASTACLGEGESAWLPQLSENAAYRTNISLTNTGTLPASVAVTLLDGSGHVLATYDVALAPGGWAQENRPFLTKAGESAMDQGYAEVTVVSGSGIIASATVIDNATNDPTSIAMVPASGVGAAGSVWLPVVSHAVGVGGSVWQSDVGVLNPSGATAHVDEVFYGAGGVATGSLVVPAGGQVIVPDVVRGLGSQGSGALQVISDQAVVVTSRTYTASANGTVGEGFGSYASAVSLAEGVSALLPQLIENGAYRTNISLTNTGTVPASATVTLLDASGHVLGSYDVTLSLGGWAQENRPFFTKGGQTDMGQGYAAVKVTSGSGVIASASVIDNATNDPTTVPMVVLQTPPGS